MNYLFDVLWNGIKVGDVSKKENKYVYKYYTKGVEEAKNKGFDYIVGFKDLNRIYESEKLFTVFSSRIFPKNRHDIDKRLKELGINEYNEIEILKKTNGKCFTDKIEVR